MELSWKQALAAFSWSAALSIADAQNSTGKSGFDYVDPLIGTTNGGAKSGMAKVVQY